MPICSLRNFFSSALLVAYLVLVAIPASQAQEPQPAQSSPIEALAAKMADAINHSKQKSVIVLDFANSDKTVTALGQRLADEFSDALAKSATSFSVVDRPHLALWKSTLIYSASIAYGIRQAWETHADVAVFGKVEMEGEALIVNVEAIRVKDRKSIRSLKVEVPFSRDFVDLKEDPAKSIAQAFATIADLKKGSFPRCIYCPRADFSEDALQQKLGGVVMLSAIIDVDGLAWDIKVEKKLGYGLDEKASDAVFTWKFKPAEGPDGKPMAVRLPIEVQFHLGL
jgi:TonB family protein